MIKRTRIKIIIVTMAILISVFITVGAVAFTIMKNRPKRYHFSSTPTGEPPKIVDADFDVAIREVESQLAKEWLTWYSLVAGTGLLGLFVITYFLSGWIVKPVKETIQKQKQFISDASHELKTPVSIISANADVLAQSEALDDNKWLCNIKAQAKRMQLLTNDLLTLARLDEKSDLCGESFCLSETIKSVVLTFESLIFEEGKTLKVNVCDNIYYYGIKDEAVRAASILIDNAIKYSSDEALIKIALCKHGDRAALEVYNTGSCISEAEKNKIFDRFYTNNYSRSRQRGGNGLGLAILKSLAEKNNWKISVESNESSYISFTILL